MGEREIQGEISACLGMHYKIHKKLRSVFYYPGNSFFLASLQLKGLWITSEDITYKRIIKRDWLRVLKKPYTAFSTLLISLQCPSLSPYYFHPYFISMFMQKTKVFNSFWRWCTLKKFNSMWLLKKEYLKPYSLA